MSDDQNPSATPSAKPDQSVASLLAYYAPSVCFVVISGVLLANTHLGLGAIDDPSTLRSLGTITIVLVVALLASYAVKRLLLPMNAPSAKSNDDTGQYRDRLARYVVVGGSVGIASTALAVIGSVDYLERAAPANAERDTLNIFTTLLPVFSTWVGTVLAFYFTNESYRQAADVARAQAGSTSDGEPITRPGTMVPYDRIVRYELKLTDRTSGNDTLADAGSLKLKTTISVLFNPPGITRVVIFDEKKIPLFVVKHDPVIDAKTVSDTMTLKDFLDTGNNRAAARNFALSASTATLADARRLLELRNVTDIFVTQHGLGDEPTIGWVPNTNLSLPSQSSP